MSSTATKSARLSKRSSKPSMSIKETSGDTENPTKSFALPTDTHLLELTNREDFESILKAALNRIVMVEFFAHWCGPCKILTSKLIELADKYKGKLLIVKVDVDEFEDLTLKHNVSAIPTFMFMKKKLVVEQFANSNADILEKTVERLLGKAEADGE